MVIPWMYDILFTWIKPFKTIFASCFYVLKRVRPSLSISDFKKEIVENLLHFLWDYDSDKIRFKSNKLL